MLVSSEDDMLVSSNNNRIVSSEDDMRVSSEDETLVSSEDKILLLLPEEHLPVAAEIIISSFKAGQSGRTNTGKKVNDVYNSDK